MPRHNPNPADITVTIPIFPKGDYEFKTGEPRPFERTKADGSISHGVRFSLECAEVLESGDPNMKGKRQIFSCYQHNDGGMSFSKGFQMAVAGFERNEQGEKEFNEWAEKYSWGYDTDEGVADDGWNELANKRVVCALDVGVNPTNDEPSQNFSAFRPV